MATVTIEGSRTPSSVLARGQRRTVQHTDRVQKLIDRGFVIVVKDETVASSRRSKSKTPSSPKPAATRDDMADDTGGDKQAPAVVHPDESGPFGLADNADE